MPKVPTIDRSVRESGLPSARVSTDAPIEAFGGGASAARAMESFNAPVNEAVKIFDEEKKKADDIAVTEAWAKASQAKNKRLYDPDSGAISRKGKNAFGVVDEYGKYYAGDLDDIEKGLQSETQKQMFRRIRQREETELNGQLQKHLFSEAQEYDKNVTNAGVAAAMDDAVNNFHEPGKIAASIKMQETLRMAHAQRAGLPADAVKVMIETDRSKTHRSVLDRMLANEQDMAAKNYYEANKDQLSGADKTAVERALAEGTSRGESQRQSDAIWLKANGSLRESLSMARENIKDPKIKDLVMARLKQRAAEEESAKKYDQDQAYEQAIGMVGDRTGFAARAGVPPSLWDKMSVAQQEAVVRRAEDVPNNSKVWLDFLAMDSNAVSSLSRADFESKFWVHLDKAHKAKAEAQWNAAKESRANPKKEQQFKSIKTDKEMILDALKEAQIFDQTDTMGTLAKDERKAQTYNDAENEIEAEFERYFNDNNKNPDDKAKRQIIGDKLKKRVFLKRSFIFDALAPDKVAPAGMVKEDDRGSAYIPIEDIPADQRTKLENQLRSRGKRVSDDKVQRLRAAQFMNDYKLFYSILEEK